MKAAPFRRKQPNFVADFPNWCYYKDSQTTSYKIENGRCRLSSQAFYEKQRRISVNRAHLCDNDPQRVQEEETDAVLSFLAERVRVVIQGKKKTKRLWTLSLM